MSEPMSIEFAAAIIAPGSPPPWFLEALTDCAGGLAQIHVQARTEPTRVELRCKLDRIAACVAELHTLMHGADGWPDIHLYAALDNVWVHDPERDGTDLTGLTYRHVPLLGELAKAAAAAIPGGPGRYGIVYNPDGMQPLEVCALVVREAWRAVRGQPPGLRNPHAFKAAEILWQATGGASPLTAQGRDWRLHFQAARKVSEVFDHPAARRFRQAARG